jgi:hypothetical protein
MLRTDMLRSGCDRVGGRLYAEERRASADALVRPGTRAADKVEDLRERQADEGQRPRSRRSLATFHTRA